MSTFIKVSSLGGEIEVDISPENCLKVGGFQAGEILINPYNGQDVVTLGVNSPPGVDGKVMWYQDEKRFAYYCIGNLKELGFKLKSETGIINKQAVR